MERSAPPSRSLVKPLLGLALAVALILALILLPINAYLEAFLTWVRALGVLGMVVVGLAYIPASLLFIPGSLLTLGAGFIFGVVHGTITVSIGSTLAAIAAFLVGRTLARDAIAARVARSQRFQVIERALSDQGFKVVLLTRLSPIFPFNLLNYAFGLTGVSLRDYALASWIGMLPGTLMYVYLGSAARDLTALVSGDLAPSPARQVLFYVGLAATIAVTVLVTRVARQALRDATGGALEQPDDAS